MGVLPEPSCARDGRAWPAGQDPTAVHRGGKRLPRSKAGLLCLHPSLGSCAITHRSLFQPFNRQQLLTNTRQPGVKISTVIYAPILIF